MRTNNRPAATALAATALASLSIIGAIPAQAADHHPTTPRSATANPKTNPEAAQHVGVEQRRVYVFTAPARLRTGPSTSRTVTGMGYPGQEAISDRNIYTARGESVTCRDGYPVNFWYLVRNTSTGVVGWVSRCWIR